MAGRDSAGLCYYRARNSADDAAELGGETSPDELDSWRGFRVPLQQPRGLGRVVA